MKLEMDVTWPACVPCDKKYDWCDHVADLIRNNKDLVPPSHTHNQGVSHAAIPYLPQQGVFAEVGWDDEMYPGARMMYLVKHTPFAPSFDFIKEYLGVWNEGEGRASICLTVRDWVRGAVIQQGKHVDCPFSAHGYREQKAIMELDESQLQLNDFFCLTEGCCFFCYKVHVLSWSRPGSGPTNFLDPPDDPGGSQILQSARDKTSGKVP